MTMRLTLPEPESDDLPADQVLATILAGALEPATRRLLLAAAAGDVRLLRALVLTGLAVGDLTNTDAGWNWSAATSRIGRLADAVDARAARASGEQLAALRTLTAPWSRPHAIADDALGERPLATGDGAVKLTVREQQILSLLASGLTAVAIGRRLRLSPRTVAKHQERIYRKFGTSDRLTTVLRAQRLGLLPVFAAEGE